MLNSHILRTVSVCLHALHWGPPCCGAAQQQVKQACKLSYTSRMSPDFIAVDVETANPRMGSICQIGLVAFKDGAVVDQFEQLINPGDHFDPWNVKVHGIRAHDVAHAPTWSECWPVLALWLEGPVCVISHTLFDRRAIAAACDDSALVWTPAPWMDSTRVVRQTWKQFAQRGYGLGNIAAFLGLEFDHHNARADAEMAGRIVCIAQQQRGQTWATLARQFASA
ncbi:exonuclease domain-containing protein [Amphibiibacter pelophylacis]|uniref:Exonuclease domain-containing protein n=1 Tax=Amphibiibacter pelophylacis TaxID=1799477 RepID=A0ACC6P1C6_9BURK